MDETWKDIEGYEESYQVSNCGRVRSMERIINHSGKTGKRFLKGVVLKQRISGEYPKVNLSKDSIHTPSHVHVLVAQAFLGERPKGLEINHIDGVKTNNHLLNLEYLTCSENNKHAFRIGLKDNKGSKNPLAKLTEDQVIEIREKCAKGEGTQQKLAEQFKVDHAVISNIAARRSWRHI